MTKKQIKKIIKKGNKLAIQTAIFNHWKLGDRPMPRFPYNNN